MSLVLQKNFSVLFTLFFVVLLLFTGCGDDKSPVEPQETSYSIIVTHGSSSKDVNLSDLSMHIIDGEEAVNLSDIVNTLNVTDPHNNAYRIIGSDGFYAHMKGNADNIWEHFQSGYILLYTMRVFFDPSLEITGRYNIKDVAEIKIIRKIDLITPADSLIQFITDEMTQTAFEDTLTGIKLTEFVSSDIVGDPRAFLYDLVAADEYTKTINYDQLMQGYYIINSDRVLYNDSDISSTLKIKHLNRIIIFNPLD